MVAAESAGTSFVGVFTLRAPACEMGRPQDAVNGCESSLASEVIFARFLSFSLSDALRLCCFFASASWIARRLMEAVVPLFPFPSSSFVQADFGSELSDNATWSEGVCVTACGALAGDFPTSEESSRVVTEADAV